MTPNFDRAQNLATELLLKQDLNSLFIDVRNFTFDRKIYIDTLQNYSLKTNRNISDFTCEEISGCCVIKTYNDINVILYNDDEPIEERKHWGIVHEVGHIYLEHDTDDAQAEIETNFFSAQIVTPEIALHAISKKRKFLDSNFLIHNFNVSKQSAQKRVSTLTRRGCYSAGTIDKQLLSKMAPILFEFEDVIAQMA